MSAMLTLDLTEEDVQRIINAAKQHGYDKPREYLVALIEADIEAEEQPLDQENDEYILNAVKQGMKEALRGEVLTEEEFWKAVREDD